MQLRAKESGPTKKGEEAVVHRDSSIIALQPHLESAAASAIDGYAIVGDCNTAALIAKNGAIDWLCVPRFDNASVFGALLDRERGGNFAVRPVGRFGVTRRYLPATNVLETTFHTAAGRLRLVDLMPVYTDEDECERFVPRGSVLRCIEGLAGEVPIGVVYAPRFDYGRVRAQLTRRGGQGVYCAHRGTALLLHGTVPLAVEGDVARTQLTVRAGDKHVLSLGFADREPLVLTPPAEAAHLVARTTDIWQSWSARSSYQGPYREQVERSLLLLKLLSFAPSGALVAAPTTSLPERPGGVRNWDYRYCWLRDASMTVRALLSLGHFDEGQRFLGWMLHTTRLTWPELRVLYDVYGETRLRERELGHLRGYRDSRPVRIGNGAKGQFQLDVYGEVLDAAFEYACHGRRRFDRATARMLAGLGDVVCRRWREPDEGMWETRAGPRHHTFSKVLCWVALDRLVRLQHMGAIDVSAHRFARERAAIEQAVEAHGYNKEIESYVTAFGSDEVDASLLLLPYYGYSASRERTRSTYHRLRQRLGDGELFYRFRADYPDGLPPGEATFAACAFWAVECLALHGEPEAARADFVRLLARANDVGLYSEEIEATSGAMLGNFPQAYTHVGLINAALTLAGRPRPSEARL
jgi:GH15 family glucan-1,4-alpha-glucosidase